MLLLNPAKNQTEITDHNHVHRGTSHITASVFIIIFPRLCIIKQSRTRHHVSIYGTQWNQLKGTSFESCGYIVVPIT